MQNEKEMTLAEKWDSLTLADNFIFCKLMSTNLDLCQDLLEVLLNIKIDHLKLANAEQTMQETFDARGVRLDVYAKDDKRIFDIEIQTTKKKNLQKRSRYYQGIIDVDNLPMGIDYDQLKETYIIFLCLDDIFGKDLPVYTFENICVENNEIKLNDGCHKIFFNASKCDKMENEDAKSFFELLKGSKSDSKLANRFKEKIAYLKQNLDLRRQYMVWALALEEEKQIAREEAREEGLAEGLAEGREAGRKQGLAEGRTEGARQQAVETATKAIQMGFSLEQIVMLTGLSADEISALRERS